MRILSIRGGGIRGIVPATILAELEASSGLGLASLFDLIVGTSTGGIIAIAAGLGMPAAQMRDLYRFRGAAIFRRRYLLGLFAARYDLAQLRAQLAAELGPHRLGDCKTKVMATAVDWDSGASVFFKSWANVDMPAIDAAQATAAAPTYFQPATVAGRRFVDGGLFANNPAPFGLVEAFKAGRSTREIKLVDIACPAAPPAARSTCGGLVGVLPTIVDACIDSGVDAAAHCCETILGANYLQIMPELHKASQRMDDASPLNVQRLLDAGQLQAPKLAGQIREFIS